MMWFTEHSTADDINQGGGNSSHDPVVLPGRADVPHRTTAHHRARAHRQAQWQPGPYLATEGWDCSGRPTEGGKEQQLLTADGYAPTRLALFRETRPSSSAY